ncbi:MAG: hypothetical protein WD114_01130 [Phycisphaerales bacterium]
MPGHTTKARTLILSAGLAALMSLGTLGAASGCASTPEIDRTKRRPHTAMRGPAYKRLVLTFNEANNLAYRADRYAKALRDSGSVDEESQREARELADELAQFADDIEWSLANNQRMVWHRTEMNRYWNRFLDLYPEDESYALAYTDDDMRKVTRKLKLKNQEEYRDLHEYERHDADWSTFFHPVGRIIYDRQIEKQDQ